MQAVTKYIITAHQQQQATSSSPTAGPCVLNIRDAFVARPGTVLLSADYSQIELRLLAHFSGDSLLRQLMHQSGSQGDVFKLIAAAWMQPGGASGRFHSLWHRHLPALSTGLFKCTRKKIGSCLIILLCYEHQHPQLRYGLAAEIIHDSLLQALCSSGVSDDMCAGVSTM